MSDQPETRGEDGVPRWPSGVGGSQCDECGETTITRHFGVWDDEDGQMLCRACAEGWNDDDWESDV